MKWKDFIGLFRGMGITLRHAFGPVFTREYPKVKLPVYPRFRGLHRLERYADGMERCIACGLCSKVCPPEAIYLEGRENPPDAPITPGERYAVIYEINMIRCIFCGYCEEVCPEDAIVLHNEFELAEYTREDCIYHKEDLLVKPDEGHGEHTRYYNRDRP